MKGPARALGNAPEKDEVRRLFLDNDIIQKVVTNTKVKLLYVREKLLQGQAKQTTRIQMLKK